MIDKWFEMFACLKKYSKKYGHTGIADGKKFDGLNVGTWADHQRRGKNKLSRHKIKLLEALPKWSWNVLEDQWNEGFTCLKKYSKKYGDARVVDGKKFDGFNLGKWVACQRKGKNKLSPKRFQLLNALPKWSWDVQEDQWNEGFACLKKYSEINGHSRIELKKKFEGYNLGNWVSHQRRGKNKLNTNKIKLLEALPKWSWNVLEDQWNEGFACLKKYSEINGHSRVAIMKKFEGFKLGNWVSSQRNGKNKLSPKRCQLLDALPKWSWDVQEDNWNESFENLKKYSKKYGHTRIAESKKFDGFNLGKWVSHQRKSKNKLSPYKINLLESLPRWTWKALEDKWSENFACLKKYSKKYGHSRITDRKKFDGFNLGQWVSNLRSVKNKLSTNKIKLLEALPKWSWNVPEDQWNKAFESLKKYSKKYGHSRIAKGKKFDGFNLGKWATHQRSGKNKLSPTRIKLLEALPQWSWSVHEDQWNEAFESLKKYSKKYGHSKIADGKKIDGFNIGKWVARQRSEKKQKRLSKERIKLLESLPGWCWVAKSK